MKSTMIHISLLLTVVGLVWAYPTGHAARITAGGKVVSYRDSLALFAPTPQEKSRIGGPKDLLVLALYFFKARLSPQEKQAFGAAIASNRHGTGKEYPYGIFELGLAPQQGFGTKAIQVFNLGSCSSESSYGISGAMLNYPDHREQWKMNFATLSGEIKDGGTIQYALRVEHVKSHFKGEFSGSAPVLLVAKAKYELFP